MRTVALLLSLLLPGSLSLEAAQRGGQAAAPARAGIALTVTDAAGTRLPGITVEVLGVSDRRGDTDANGQITFSGMQAETYRLRFSGEPVIGFEREVTLRAGQVTALDITLHRAPERPQPAPVPTAAAPVGMPHTLSVVDVLEDEFIGRQPRRESLLSCSGTLRTTMIQLNEPQAERLYDTADAVYYVLGGQGSIQINGREARLDTNGFASVPRGTPHSFTRRGNRPFVLMAVLGGTPCEEAR